jgi:mannose-6-phosphate isomerase-like protein (cupin superfamily)
MSKKFKNNQSYFPILQLPTFQDERGLLTVLDGILPFEIERTYWIYGADGQVRGGHRHHKTRQALIAISGVVIVHMDDGVVCDNIQLDSPSHCLLVEPKDWHTMSFGANSVLLVISSEHYDRSDYIDERYPNHD